MDIDIANSYMQFAAHTVTFLGFPFALYLFYRDKKREQRDREYGTYNALDDKYIQFLEMCLDKPELNVYDYSISLGSGQNCDSTLKSRQEQVLFTILISILERAYLMYRDQNSEIKRKQWAGWVEYFKDYSKSEGFRRQWPQLGPQFDTEFVAFMQKIFDEAIL